MFFCVLGSPSSLSPDLRNRGPCWLQHIVGTRKVFVKWFQGGALPAAAKALPGRLWPLASLISSLRARDSPPGAQREPWGPSWNWAPTRGSEGYQGIRDTKGTLHAKRSSIKDGNGRDLTEAEDIKKRWQEYTEELYKKDLHDPDNHNGEITHLEPDILEWEVKWALGSIPTNRDSGVMEFQLSYFTSWKMML